MFSYQTLIDTTKVSLPYGRSSGKIMKWHGLKLLIYIYEKRMVRGD